MRAWEEKGFDRRREWPASGGVGVKGFGAGFKADPPAFKNRRLGFKPSDKDGSITSSAAEGFRVANAAIYLPYADLDLGDALEGAVATRDAAGRVTRFDVTVGGQPV